MPSEIEDFVAAVYGWQGCVRPDTFDLTAIKEIYVEDVYRAKPWMKDATVLDLGANVGVFSVWAIQHGAKKVVAIECCQENFELLQANTAGCAGVFPVHAAIGPEEGRASAVYKGPKDAHMSYAQFQEPGEVKMHNLDSIANDPFDFVKVDIEGAEWEIFQTARKKTMEKMRHIGIEFHGTDCPGSAPQPEGAFGRLMEKLSETHCIHTLGTASKGGMIYADAY